MSSFAVESLFTPNISNDAKAITLSILEQINGENQSSAISSLLVTSLTTDFSGTHAMLTFSCSLVEALVTSATNSVYDSSDKLEAGKLIANTMLQYFHGTNITYVESGVTKTLLSPGSKITDDTFNSLNTTFQAEAVIENSISALITGAKNHQLLQAVITVALDPSTLTALSTISENGVQEIESSASSCSSFWSNLFKKKAVVVSTPKNTV